MLRIGLTGGIGSGKSVVANMLVSLGTPVIDADAISHGLTRRDAPGYSRIVAAFGKDCLAPDGELDRRALRGRIFTRPEDRRRLESILHPLIRAEVVEAMAPLSSPYVVIVAPLLIESGFTDLVDRVLVVDCDEAEQIRRTRARSGLPEAEIQLIMQSQLDRQSRLAAAHDVLRNDSGLDALEDSVRQLHQKYLKLADGRH